MSNQLVIVESPAKASTIQTFLGSEYTVLSSYGHVRDLPKKRLAIDVDNDFHPEYLIPEDKKKRVNELKKAAKQAETVWLATDEDREGEAIAWHLKQALELSEDSVKRITFHEITQEAIKQALEGPRDIDQNLVDTQQARRVLDRLVGYELSPLLWKKVQPGLSAGRVQSVAVRLIVEREREIDAFQPRSKFKISATFRTQNEEELPAELTAPITDKSEAQTLLDNAAQTQFRVADVTQKPATRNPSPPFTTSTLQQVASRKLGYSVKQTMTLAQRLYEAGHITYMRTDSVALSDTALKQIKDAIVEAYGEDYYRHRTYQSKADAQEAHEAIRPTKADTATVSSDKGEQRLYELIRGRTLASQMAPAQLNTTTITIAGEDISEQFRAKGDVITFAGWMEAYHDSKVNETILPQVSTDEALRRESLHARQTLTRAPARYSEAALVRKLEAMGIGRPSTYAPTISTIQDRGYIEKGDVRGEERAIAVLTLNEDSHVEETEETISYGQDKGKLLPTQVAFLVTDFLTKNFPDIVDYDFTKEAEEEFDRIAQGQETWNRMIASFYGPFHDKVTQAQSLSREEASGARELGTDPETDKPVIARMGRYGPMLQLGRAQDEEKPKFAPIPEDKTIRDITLEDALQLLQLPRTVGTDENGEDIQAGYGPYGPYVKSQKVFAPIPEGEDPFSVTQEAARTALAQKRERNAKRTIADFGDIKILHGRFGPYVTDGKRNAKIPNDVTPEELDEEQAKTILATPKKRQGSRSK